MCRNWIVFLGIQTLLWTFTACQRLTVGKEVIYTTIIHRHGARTPLVYFPSDPNIHNHAWSIGEGQLTNEGKTQEYQLGKDLRKRYANLLPEFYHVDDIYVFSTDMDRTLMSAQCSMTGLYPPKGEQVWNPELNLYQPIPIHSIRAQDDNMVMSKKQCPKYNLLLDKLINSEDFTDVRKKVKKLQLYLSEKLNYTVKTFQDIEDVNDIFKIESEQNLPWPSWLTEDVRLSVRKYALLSLRTQTYTPPLQRLKMGVLLNEILSNMKAKTQGTITKKMWVYSAHDTTLINMMQTLNVFVPHFPNYASAIYFDLLKINDQYGVEIFYRNSTTDEPVLLKMPDCDYICELSKFTSILKGVTLTSDEWDKECKLKFFEKLL